MTDLEQYPSGTIIAVHNIPDLEGDREWFVRLPDHLIPAQLRGQRAVWRSLADGQVWPLDPHLMHDIVAYPNAPHPALINEGDQPWG